MDPGIARYLDELVSAARGVLGDDFVGAYAAGSVALGAYQPGRSDVDVALVCAGPLSLDIKEQLVQRLRHEHLPCPARGLELVVYRLNVARSGTPDPGFEVELNTGARMDFLATFSGGDRAETDGRFWYAIDRSILREHGLVLAGPPVSEIFGDISDADIRSLLAEALRWFLAQPAPEGNQPQPWAEDAVLGACRALVRIRTRKWRAKLPAGDEVAATGFEPDLIRQSIAARSGGVPPGAADARRFQQRVLAQILGAD